MSDKDNRRIKLDIRKSLDSPDSQFMMILLDPEAKQIRDLVKMIKQLFPGLEDCKDVKMYQGKYLLPEDVDIGVIKTQQDVIVVQNPNTKDVVVKKEYCEEDEMTIQMKIASTQTDATLVEIASTQTNAVPTNPIPLPQSQKVTRIESLGNNTVNFQMIVQGPDKAEAIAISRKLNSGEAKLGRVFGKKVLFYTSEKGSIQQEKGGPNNNNDASSTAPSAKRLCTELKK